MKEVELAVVGAGPAGLGGAIESARLGTRVVVLDENKRPGGQLFKQIHKFFGSKEHLAGIRGFTIGEMLLREAELLGIPVNLDSTVIGIDHDKVLAYVNRERVHYLKAEKILLATGAAENVLPFPGWTLPGVMGAGALQTMINIERVLPGRRVLMIGTGNVGLIVSYQLLQAGARVVALIDVKGEIGGYQVHGAKLKRAGVPIYLRHTIAGARGKKGVERAVIVEIDRDNKRVPGTEKELRVDLICLAVGLSPLTDLVNLLGCKTIHLPELGGLTPLHDENMETTCPGIYVAGDLAGVEEASAALDKGRLAGVAIAESLGYLSGEEAFARKEIIRQRLQALRSGPLGKLKLQGYETIYETMRRGKNGPAG